MRRHQTANLARAGIGVVLTFVASAVAPALLFSALVHSAEWLSLRSPNAAQASLTRLGLRLMAGSVVFTILIVWSLTGR